MKKIEIDGKKLIIYEDGSIRIPHKDMHLCLDFMDIVFLYNESIKARNEREPDSKDTELIVKRSICKKSYQKVKAMKLNDQKIERRRFKRHKVSRRPIAILGPDPVRVGHVTTISDDAAEIQFSETSCSAATKFSELFVLIPEYNSAYLSGKIHVETVSCSTARMNGIGLRSRMRKCVISLNNLNPKKRQQLKNWCL